MDIDESDPLLTEPTLLQRWEKDGWVVLVADGKVPVKINVSRRLFVDDRGRTHKLEKLFLSTPNFILLSTTSDIWIQVNGDGSAFIQYSFSIKEYTVFHA